MIVDCGSVGCVKRSFMIGLSLKPRSLWGSSMGGARSWKETRLVLQRVLWSVGRRRGRLAAWRVFLREEPSPSLLVLADRQHFVFDLDVFSKFEDITLLIKQNQIRIEGTTQRSFNVANIKATSRWLLVSYNLFRQDMGFDGVSAMPMAVSAIFQEDFYPRQIFTTVSTLENYAKKFQDTNTRIPWD